MKKVEFRYVTGEVLLNGLLSQSLLDKWMMQCVVDHVSYEGDKMIVWIVE